MFIWCPDKICEHSLQWWVHTDPHCTVPTVCSSGTLTALVFLVVLEQQWRSQQKPFGITSTFQSVIISNAGIPYWTVGMQKDTQVRTCLWWRVPDREVELCFVFVMLCNSLTFEYSCNSMLLTNYQQAFSKYHAAPGCNRSGDPHIMVLR